MMHVRVAKVGIGLLVLVLGGCDFTRTLDVNTQDHESKLVLQGQMQPQQPLRVAVSRSVGAFESGEVDDDQFSVTDATMTVFQGDQRLGTLSRDSLNRYSTEGISFTAGTSYTIQASAPGLDSVEVTDRIPVLPPTGLSLASTSADERTLRLTIEDAPSTANYYRIALWEVTQNEVGERFRSEAYFETTAQAIVQEVGSQAAGRYDGHDAFFPDEIFDGDTYRIDLQVDRKTGRMAFVLLVYGFSADTYRYRRFEDRAEGAGEGPFAEPIDLEGNVEGGYGLIEARSVDTLRYRTGAASE